MFGWTGKLLIASISTATILPASSSAGWFNFSAGFANRGGGYQGAAGFRQQDAPPSYGETVHERTPFPTAAGQSGKSAEAVRVASTKAPLPVTTGEPMGTPVPDQNVPIAVSSEPAPLPTAVAVSGCARTSSTLPLPRLTIDLLPDPHSQVPAGDPDGRHSFEIRPAGSPVRDPMTPSSRGDVQGFV